MTRSVPNQFASLINPTLPNLDADFAAVTPATVLPCTAAGTNAITLTPVAATLSVTAYTDKEQYSFNAPATSTGVMTLQVAALGLLKLFKAGGTTQATTGDVISTQFYQVAYQASLDSGNGGFVIVSAIAAQVIALTQTSGLWTPAISATGTSGTHTYSTQFGRYIQTGNMVYVSANVQLSAKDSSISGNLIISGLPFPAGIGANYLQSFAIGAWGNLNLSGGATVPTAFVNGGTSVISIDQAGSGLPLQVLNATGVVSNTQLIFSGVYSIAP